MERKRILPSIYPQTSIVTQLQPLAHEPGVFTKWLDEQKAESIIVAGKGQRTRKLLAQNSIKVVLGASAQDSTQMAKDYLDDALELKNNACDHWLW